MRIIKILIVILGIITLLLVILFGVTFTVVKDIKIKDLVEREIEEQLGINVTIQKLSYSPLLTHISAEGITIHNPPGFTEDELAYLNSLRLVWDLGDMVLLKKPNIYLCGIDLERLNIIKNKQGKINIKEIVPIRDPKSVSQDTTPFFFDVLVLSIGKVSYTEHTASGAKTRIFPIGLKNQAFVALNDENEVIKLIIYKAIQNTNIGKLIDLTLTPAFSGVSDTIDAAWSTAKVGAKSVFQIASTPFKLIFGK